MNPFEKIINQAIADAEEVHCSTEDFELGMALMLHTLKNRLECDDIDYRSEEVLERLAVMEGTS